MNRHLGCLQFFTSVSRTTMSILIQTFFVKVFFISLRQIVGVKLLEHRVCVHLVLLGTVTTFCKEISPFYTSISKHESSGFSRSSATLDVSVLNCSHSGGCIMLPHHGFCLRFPDV